MDFVAREAKYECLLFDIDDTLYPMSTGLNLACRKNIQDYMLHHLKIEESNVPQMCVDLYKEYGTTIASLKIFTNADKAHAIRVLNRLDLEILTPPTGLNIKNGKKNDSLPANQAKHRIFGTSEFESDDVQDCDGASDGEPKFRILCKPSVEAIEAAIKIANVDCKKTDILSNGSGVQEMAHIANGHDHGNCVSPTNQSFFNRGLYSFPSEARSSSSQRSSWRMGGTRQIKTSRTSLSSTLCSGSAVDVKEYGMMVVFLLSNMSGIMWNWSHAKSSYLVS